jgi:ubiquinone/menaquinone biosynthesis C-methylase UbiE
MDHSDAVALVADAVGRSPGTWADLGAGDGTFTRALVELLGRESRIYAVDRDARALAALARWAKTHAPHVVTVVADFSRPFEWPDAATPTLDGIVLANVLHFVADQSAVLARLAAWLVPGGRVVLIEYDRRGASPWVPHPIPLASLPTLAAAAGLATPVVTATRRSDYGGDMYAAVATRSSRR